MNYIKSVNLEKIINTLIKINYLRVMYFTNLNNSTFNSKYQINL